MRFNLDGKYLLKAAVASVISTLAYKALLEPTINKWVWGS